ncbi:MAG: hypothetical protein ACOC5D_00715 [Thermoplasmatota archaeon]
MVCRNAEEIIKDNQKGAAELMKDMGENILDRNIIEAKEYIMKIIKNRYSMTPLINLSNVFFTALDDGDDFSEEVKNYMNKVEESRNETINKMKSIIDKNDFHHAVTISYSSTVIDTIKDISKATVFESRPLNEGRKTAKLLRSNDTDVEYWIDAAMLKGLEDCDFVIIGTDTISHEGFLNKIGSYPLVISAKEKDIPVYAVSDESKLMPKDLIMSKGERHPSNEVWETSKEIEVHNEYFERVPLKYVSFVIGKRVFDKYEIINKLKKKEVSDLLKEFYPLG